MKASIIFILAGFLLVTCGQQEEKKKYCLISGKVVDRNSETLMLKKATDNLRYTGIKIPINEDKTFEYLFEVPVIEAYELIFKEELDSRMWKANTFFPDGDTISFELHPLKAIDNNKIIGSKLTTILNDYSDEIQYNFNARLSYWNNLKYSTSSSEDGSEEYLKFVSNKIDSTNNEITKWKLEYIETNQNLVGYSQFLSMLRAATGDNLSVELLKRYYNILQQKFPGHPYNSIAQNRINSLENLKVGGTYVDFTAPDKEGNVIKISEQITKNKLTLIDLWARWCGPCIKKSKKIVPLYDELKASGFDVVAVVGGISDMESFTKAVEKYKYPWTTLVEINNEYRIWEKYNIIRSGGNQFLVDSEGKILAINPKPDEIMELLAAS